MAARPARDRKAPQNFCSGPGQVPLSQEPEPEPEPAPPAPRKARKPKSPRKSPPKRSRSAPPVRAPDDDEEAEFDPENDPIPLILPPARVELAASDVEPIPPRHPEKVGTGVRSFAAWWLARAAAPPTRFTDHAQTVIVNSEFETINPVDILCEFTHVARRKIIMPWLDECTTAKGPSAGEPLASSALRQYALDVFKYLKHWESQDDSRLDAYGSWGMDHHAFRELKDFLHKRLKQESGLTAATAALTLDADDPDDASMLAKMGHNSATIPPEHVELMCMWLRGKLDSYEKVRARAARARGRRVGGACGTERKRGAPRALARARLLRKSCSLTRARTVRLRQGRVGAVPWHAALDRLLGLPVLLPDALRHPLGLQRRPARQGRLR